MRKAAVVVADLGGFKEIEVSRSSACEGCSQNKDGSCHACIALGDKNRAMRTKARDELGAEVGDRVIVETDSGTVIRYAAEVFLLPILLAAVGYFVGGLIGGEIVPYIGALLGFAAAFVFVKLVPAKRAENNCDVRIVRIIGRQESTDHDI